MPDLGLPLNGGFLPPVPPNASQDAQINAINDIINRLNGLLKTQYFSDGTTRRMLIGYQENGWGAGKSFGMKVSIPGIDVATATDSQLLFKMDLATWYFYDPATSKNFMQFGILPDGVGGWAVADTGRDVSEGF